MLIRSSQKMGLEGVFLNQTMEHFGGIGALHIDPLLQSDCSQALSLPFQLDGENSQLPLDLMIQAQSLLRRSAVYQEINQALLKAKVFQPCGYAQPLSGVDDDNRVTSLYRDAAVNNLRFFNIFYGYKPTTFSLAVNILDRLLGKVKANSKYLSCIATSCFYIAAKTQENPVCLPTATELIKLSQCGGGEQDLVNMERCIIEKLEWQFNGVTPLTFLKLFYQLIVDDEDEKVYNALVSSLEVLMCRHDFVRFRMETVALALISYQLQEIGFIDTADKFSTVVEAQFYCQIGDEEMLQCRGLIKDYLALYYNRPSKLPRLQLAWSVSSRTLKKMKPSTKVLSDLEPIMEDEDDEGNDAGVFDSENDDSELERQIRMMRLKSQQQQEPVMRQKVDNRPVSAVYKEKAAIDKSTAQPTKQEPSF